MGLTREQKQARAKEPAIRAAVRNQGEDSWAMRPEASRWPVPRNTRAVSTAERDGSRMAVLIFDIPTCVRGCCSDCSWSLTPAEFELRVQAVRNLLEANSWAVGDLSHFEPPALEREQALGASHSRRGI